MPSSPPMVRQISKCTVKPSPDSPHGRRRLNMTPWDLTMLSPNYIQKGLLFSNLPPSLSTDRVIDRLKSSLSMALLHFFPLAGRLVTDQVYNDTETPGMFVSIDCNGEGAEFIHAVADKVTVNDVLAPLDDVPAFILSFFPLDGAINHDGHHLPLLAVQVTELADGIFVACSLNHAVVDGTSYWHFFNAWSKICRTKATGEEGGGIIITISRPPVHDRWFAEGANPPIKLPFSHPGEFIGRSSPPPLTVRERMFHFTSNSIAQLKSKANEECNCNTNKISSLQALSSLVWRSITRARHLPPDQKTSCRMAIQNRPRLQPPLSPDYFGNSIYVICTTATAGELLERGIGWGALQLHERVAAHTDGAIRQEVAGWVDRPVVKGLCMFDPYSVMMGSSPRFDMYGCDFGWGKAAAVRSGSANKFDGKVMSYPGWEGGGSVDLEVSLAPETMSALEADMEFMGAVPPLPPHES